MHRSRIGPMHVKLYEDIAGTPHSDDYAFRCGSPAAT